MQVAMMIAGSVEGAIRMPRRSEPRYEFGRWLRRERLARVGSIDDMARRLRAVGVDISRSKVGELELYDDPRRIPAGHLEGLALVLDVPAATVLEAAGLQTQGPTRIAELSVEEAGAIKDLRAMSGEERRHWIRTLRASRAYGRSEP